MNEEFIEGYIRGVEDSIEILKMVLKNVDKNSLERLKKLMIVKVLNKSGKKPTFLIRYGSVVTIDERDGRKVYEIFRQAISRCGRAMCITYRSPGSVNISEEFREKVDLVWMTEYKREGRNREDVTDGRVKVKVSPSDLISLTHLINEFIEEDRKRIVMLDNFNKIVMHVGKDSNSISQLAKFLDRICGCALENEGILLLSVDLSSVESSLADQIRNLSSRLVK